MILVGYFQKKLPASEVRSTQDSHGPLPPLFFFWGPSDPWKEERADSDPTGALTPKEWPIRTEDVKTCNSTSVSVDKNNQTWANYQKHITDICFLEMWQERNSHKKKRQKYIEISYRCLFCNVYNLVWWEGLCRWVRVSTGPRTCSQRHSKHQSLHGLLGWNRGSERNFSSDTEKRGWLEEKSGIFLAFCFKKAVH